MIRMSWIVKIWREHDRGGVNKRKRLWKERAGSVGATERCTGRVRRDCAGVTGLPGLEGDRVLFPGESPALETTNTKSSQVSAVAKSRDKSHLIRSVSPLPAFP